MGLFDIFKKKPVGKNLPEKCSECFRPIDGYIWNLDNKKYCQECYNRRMAIVHQTAGQSPEEYDFEMTIEDVFFIKNHGVVVTGKIHRGVIHRDDAVTINGATYTVTLIDVIPNQVEYAKEGANVGLHLSTMNAALFKRGDLVTAKRFEATPQTNTFICDVCKQEFPIKYRHKGNTCVKCAETVRKNIGVTNPDSKANDTLEIEYLDDITFIREIKHTTAGPWHQYDVLLAARGYGWDMMKDWADYMSDVDLEHISQVTTGSLGVQEKDITKSYTDNGGRCKSMPELNVEMGILSIAGMSKTLKAPMKIVWINQTQVLRFFTLVNDDLLIKKYVETTIRRTFGTENAMKLGKPIPEGQ